MPPIVLQTAALLAWTCVSLLLWRARPLLTGTTLTNAWTWGALAWIGWGVLLLGDAFRPGDISRPLQYLEAVLLLCPALAVLGAKRPMSRVWSAFVITPLLLVLGWSDVAVLIRPGDRPETWQLEDPVAVGYALVVVMTAGNHLASRFVLAELIWLAGLAITVGPLTNAGHSLADPSATTRALSTLCFSGAAAVAYWTATNPPVAATPSDALWLDFRDWFGVLWARRIQDRMNQAAVQFNWPVRLELEGFIARAPASQTLTGQSTLLATENLPPEPTQSLCWLLRRFADQPWIDARLNRPVAADSTLCPTKNPER